ncbi:hypothetical protein HMPREF1017_00768 [Bacteroides ovatus 3_8_47FAA]|uniref:hypothetical protein n=1 Tax=Bacteroides ovatus TaxID=28116 RepID=UPI000213211B|nr:hypothetical protein [Bacteroides ovatus]EGN00242.1 hypothetical protein HMPREF1017_00768 [Bacteroides ovatus 3_8_47FAA]QGT70224.1 hypothetical protein FOC41_04265 [Bacteroides ovatus]
MKTQLTINDLPPDVVGQMKQAIRKDSAIQALQKKRNNALRSNNYIEASKLSKLIDDVETRTINQYLSEYKGQAKRMDILMTDMSKEDRESMNVYTNAIIFLCDIIETLSIESDDILKKYHPDYNLEMFNKISQIGKEAKSHIKFMSDNTDMVYQISFADEADDISELLFNKVKSFIRKLRRKNEVA